jgi:hypothetical protein
MMQSPFRMILRLEAWGTLALTHGYGHSVHHLILEDFEYFTPLHRPFVQNAELFFYEPLVI